MKKSFLALLCFILVFVSACSAQPTLPAQPAPTSTPAAAIPATQPAGQTSVPAVPMPPQILLEQKVGQAFLIRFSGTTLEPEVREMIEKYHIGGVVLGAGNITSPLQLAGLVASLQDAALKSGHPGLIIALEQDGGSSSPLSAAQGFTSVPGPLAIAATGKKQNALETGKLLGSEMNLLGINTAFAPLLDVTDYAPDGLPGVLNTYGSLPEKTSPFGLNYLAGLQQSGVMAVGRYFPGLPAVKDAAPDTNGIPTDSRSLADLKISSLSPFQDAVNAGIGGLITANRIFLGLEPDKMTPASLSKKIQTDLLRTQMRFSGLIITDTLQKDLLAKINRSVAQAAVQALQAGADLLQMGSDQAENLAAILAVQKSVQDGQISAEQLSAGYTRILKSKQKFKIAQPAPVDPQSAAAKAGQDPHVGQTAAQESITLLRDDAGLLPLQEDEKSLVIQTPAGRGLGALLKTDFIDISNQPSAAEIEQALAKSAGVQKVILVTTDAGRNIQQVELVKALQARKIPLIVVAAGEPFDLISFKEVGTYLVTYGMPPVTLQALAGILNGSLSPQGQLPIALPRLYQVGSGMISTTK